MNATLSLLLVTAGLASTRPLHDAPPEDDVARYRATLAGLDTPRAVAVGPDDRIYVAEADRVRAFTPAGEAAGTLTAPADGFAEPRGLSVAPDGHVYVADTGNDRLLAFDANGELQATIGERGVGRGQLRRPLGLAVDAEHILVCDAGNRRVQVFSRSGEPLGELEPAQPFDQPVDVAFGPGDRIVVADGGRYQCVVFDAADGEGANGTFGTEVARFGDIGWFPGLFSRVAGIAVSRGRIYVADAENHRVQEFDPSGELVVKWGLHAIRPREGRGKLHYPAHIAIAPSGDFSVLAEPYDDRVQVFGRGAEVVGAADVFRQTKTQPSPHYGFRASAEGNWLVIAEPETHELLVFDTQIDPPRLVSRVGAYGERMGLFEEPVGIDLDAETRTVVATERAGRRMQLFELRVDPDADVAFDREMAMFIRTLDFDRLGLELAGVKLDWPVEPTAVVRDARGRAFLLDAANDRIHVFSPDLVPLESFGGHGRAAGQLRGATDLALDPTGERVYVVDAWNRRIQAFSTSGEALFEFDGSPGERLERPWGIAVAENGRVFVTDRGSHRLLWFGPEGEPLGALGGKGIQRGKLYKPRDVEIDGRGRVLVIDHGNHRGHVFSQEGEYLDCFGPRLYTRPARLPETYDPSEYEQ